MRSVWKIERRPQVTVEMKNVRISWGARRDMVPGLKPGILTNVIHRPEGRCFHRKNVRG